MRSKRLISKRYISYRKTKENCFVYAHNNVKQSACVSVRHQANNKYPQNCGYLAFVLSVRSVLCVVQCLCSSATKKQQKKEKQAIIFR